MIKNRYSKIKNVIIELNDYEFYHSPSELGGNNPCFIGRRKVKEELELVLNNSAINRGAYLVTGYRGMGKTSVVREVINKIRKNDKTTSNLIVIELALSQGSRDSEVDILRQLTRQLYVNLDELLSPVDKKIFKWLEYAYILFLLSFFLFFAFNYSFFHEQFNSFILTQSKGCELLIYVAGIVLTFGGIKLKNCLANPRAKSDLELKQIFYSLKEFNDRLYAAVTKEKELFESKKVSFGWKLFKDLVVGDASVASYQKDERSKKHQNYSVATSKEVEKELILILNKIDKCRKKKEEEKKKKWRIKKEGITIPKFIFIIDELDKLEPGFPTNKDHLNSNTRKEKVANLLANLKNFLNTAKAKFVFIGGRDLFDESLADIADREAFYSSIFDKVIYVNSFFKDKLEGQRSGISELTEGFVCQKLNKKNVEGEYKLKTFIQAIEKNDKLKINSRELAKITFLLQNFIIFLTYRSNGSPKKLNEIFERYIVNNTSIKETEYNTIKIQTLGEKSSSKLNQYSLKFSFTDQYEIGATANLYRPYLIIHSRHLKMLEDKLLYSTAFLIDHILKFHKHAFSWRNLELLPDIILANKDPNLRDFLQEIMDFFFLMHIRKTINAIFEFKYYSKTTNELKYLSKISALSSAAFNFTLDESSHIKEYYKFKLREKYKEHKELSFATHTPQYIHSIGYYNNILGDLHFYDEHYDDAISRYTDAIQTLRISLSNNESISSHQSLLYVKVKLKLGLALEKKRAYDSAYSIYRTLILRIDKIIHHENVVKKEKSWEEPYRRMQVFLRPHISLLDVIEKQRADGITFSNLQRNIKDYSKFLQLSDNKFPFKEYKKSEYTNLCGDLNSDSKRIQTLLFDYYNNVGSLLFYKNKNFIRLHREAFNSLLQHELKISFFDKNKEIELSGKEGQLTNYKQEDFHISNLYDFIKIQCIDKDKSIDKSLLDVYCPSLSAYFYYRMSIKEFILPYEENFTEIKFNIFDDNPNIIGDNDLVKILFFLLREGQMILNSTQFYILGNIISKLGDACLSIISTHSVGSLNSATIELLVKDIKEENNRDEIKELIEYFGCKFPSTETNPQNLKDFFDVKLVLLLYYVSSLLYKRAAQEYSSSFQIKKVLYVLRDYISTYNKRSFADASNFQGFTSNLLEGLAMKIINSTSSTSGVSHRAQILKYRELLTKNITGHFDYTSLIYTNTTTSPDIKEAIILVESIKQKLQYINHPEFRNFIPSFELLDTDIVSNIFIRILEMKYQSDLNYYAFFGKLKMKEPKSRDQNLEVFIELLRLKLENNIDRLEVIKQLICDSMFCLREAIKIIDTYGVSYVVNYSFLGYLHLNLSNWCCWYDIFKNVDNSIVEELKKLVGKYNTVLLESYYHKDLAKKMFSKAIGYHTEGKSYKSAKWNMYFLEDDYNDNLSHFCAANERFRINLGLITKKINSLDKELSNSKLNIYESYLRDIDLGLKHFYCVLADDKESNSNFTSIINDFLNGFNDKDRSLYDIQNIETQLSVFPLDSNAKNKIILDLKNFMIKRSNEPE